MSPAPIPPEVEARLGALQAELTARERTITVLMDRIERRLESDVVADGAFELSLSLERAVERRTRELESLVDELKRTQARLVQAQKLESIGQLAAGIAHEINTPLQFISDNTQFLSRVLGRALEVIDTTEKACEELAGVQHPVVASIRDSLQGALRHAKPEFVRREAPIAFAQCKEGLNRVTRIVGAMKEFSYPSRGQKEPTELNRLLETIVTVSRNEWKYVAEVRLELEPTLPEVSCLRDELGQVVLNLIVNSAHAIADDARWSGEAKGRITIRTRSDAASAGVVIEVEDNGVGIPPECIDRVFDLFYTTKQVGRGTGQGLAIGYGVVVDKHGGEITVQSTPGVGTTFRITLPGS